MKTELERKLNNPRTKRDRREKKEGMLLTGARKEQSHDHIQNHIVNNKSMKISIICTKFKQKH